MYMVFRKLTAVAVISTMTISLLTSAAFAAPKEKQKEWDKKIKQLTVITEISKHSKGKEKVSWNTRKGVPHFVSGKLSKKKLKDSGDARHIMNEIKDAFDMDSPEDELNLTDTSSDELGMMFKYQQVHKGIPVFGNQLILHANSDGEASIVTGYYDPEIKKAGVKTRPKMADNEAIEAAKNELGLSSVQQFEVSKAELYIYESKDQKYHLAYLVTLSTLEGEQPAYWDVFVDARDGDILNKIDKLSTADAVGSGTGVLGDSKSLHTDSYSGGYYLRDVSKPMNATGGKIETYTAKNGTSLPGTLMTDTDNVWTDGAAVDAHYYAGAVYDYYYQKHNRNSFDGNGASLKSTVHYSSRYNNAFWDGVQMVYGDGDGTTFRPLSGSLDVVGHEITHAVTERTANLVYQDQPGALNESFSDVFGNLIENKSDENWLVGEDIYTPGTSGDALRSMSNPTQFGDPDHMRDYVYTSSDNGGVHTNSGIPNKAFYNFVTSPGVTRDDAGKVWYRALSRYLTTNSQFVDARNATIQAATDLFGANSAQVQAVTNAWDDVGVGSTSSGGDSYEPNDSLSQAYGPIDSDVVYNGKISTGTDADWFKFTTNSGGSIQLSLSNLPADYDLYFYDENGNQLGRSWNGGTSSESISYSASAAGTFYAKVIGYNGAMSNSQSYALKVTYPTSNNSAQWYYQNMTFDTPHPYANNYNNGTQHTYSKPGAQKVALHFSRFETEANYDLVHIKDKNGNVVNTYSGNLNAFWAIVDGDTITSNLVTDYSITHYGYTIDQVGYFSTAPLEETDSEKTDSPIIGKDK